MKKYEASIQGTMKSYSRTTKNIQNNSWERKYELRFKDDKKTSRKMGRDGSKKAYDSRAG
jgi:hypothetical protein